MTDLAELFARDPLTFTKEGGEVAAIVARLRESRGQFALGNQKAGSMKPAKPSKTAAKLTGVKLNINLESLLNKGALPQKKEEPNGNP